MSIVLLPYSVYAIPMVKTMAIGFDSLCRQRRTHRPLIGGFFASAICRCAPLWAGCGGGIFGCAGFLCHRSVNPAVCPSTPIDSGERVKPDIGGHHMAHSFASARPEQTETTFPLAARAARKAVRQWFAGIPTLSLVLWRDDRCKAHCSGLPAPQQRMQAFNDAFSREIGEIILAGGRA